MSGNLTVSENRVTTIGKVVHGNGMFLKNYTSLSQNEIRVLLYICSQLPHYKKTTYCYEEGEIPSVRVPVSVLATLMNFNGPRADWITRFKQILARTATATFTFNSPTGITAYFPWFEGIYVEKETDSCVFSFNRRVSGYLVGLSRSFEAYELGYVCALSSVFSIRLYDLCKEIEYRGNQVVPLTDLRVALGLIKIEEAETGERVLSFKTPDYNRFVKKVLAPAVEEVNRITDLTVTWEPVRDAKGQHPVVAIRFSVQKKGSCITFEQWAALKDGGTVVAPEELPLLSDKRVSCESGEQISLFVS